MDCKRRKTAFTRAELPAVRKHAFTLVELLIVIAVLAVLLSILLPTLRHTTYLAQRASCVSNITQQHTAQMAYASDNRGKFPPRIVCGADYVRLGDNTGPWYTMKKTGNYLPDSQILICPLLVHFGGVYADTHFYYPQFPGYGSWDAGRTYVISAYTWFANYRPDDHVFVPDEPPWPKNAAECDKSRAFISHRITYSLTSGHFDDWGHLGSDRHNPPNSGDFDELCESPDQPVGYGDGHVEVHPKSQVRRRTLRDTWYNFEWYY